MAELDRAGQTVRYPELTIVSQDRIISTAPESGIALPDATVAAGDSYTCTIRGLGALAIGIGTGEIEYILAPQTLMLRPPRA